MAENCPITVLDESEKADTKNIEFELDILGEAVNLRIGITENKARLADIVPAARALSTKVALAVLAKLRKDGQSLPCRKGCSACCSYLIPLSVPEAFRLRQEVLAMPPERSRVILQSCLEKAKDLLNEKLNKFDTNEFAERNDQTQIAQLSKWYVGLDLTCPFLSDGLCNIYQQRPTACREHIVTDSALLCEAGLPEEPHMVPMPVSVIECLGQLTAELEQSEIEAVILPLALPWAQENLERCERMFPAVTMVERFVVIVKTMAADRLIERSCHSDLCFA